MNCSSLWYNTDDSLSVDSFGWAFSRLDRGWACRAMPMSMLAFSTSDCHINHSSQFSYTC